MLDELLLPGTILFPPVVIRYATPIAQQIAVPVFTPAYAAIARLEAANTAFHLVVGPREGLPIVTLHQMRSQVGELLQELAEALLLQVAECAISQALRHVLPPSIQALSNGLIAHDCSRLRPACVQEVLYIEHPLPHALDLCQRLGPSRPLGDNGLEASHFLAEQRAHRSPFFSSRSRLACTWSKASPAATAG